MRKSSRSNTHTIQLRVDSASQLFDTMDPFPFRERDLDGKVEEYIAGWARDLPAHANLEILIHISGEAGSTDASDSIREAFEKHFRYRAERVALDLRELFRRGRYALAVGLCVLAGAIGLRQSLTLFGAFAASPFVGEGLLIIGWVANWRPMEIFLYDWWPLVRSRNLYRRLAHAPVRLKRAV